MARHLKYFGEGLGKGKQESLKQVVCVKGVPIKDQKGEEKRIGCIYIRDERRFGRMLEPFSFQSYSKI